MLSILPAGGFSRLMIGSQVLYKESQRCIILGFSDKAVVEQDLGVLENDVLGQVKQSVYCTQPDKQKALVLFIGDGNNAFIPEVRALEISSLVPIPTIIESPKKSILYEQIVIKSLIEILREDVNDQSPLVLKQSQVQILKAITFVVDQEAKENGHSDFLKFLQTEGLLKDLFTFLERNANKPQIKSQGDLNLPNELLEIQLTSIRIKNLESQFSLLSSNYLSVVFSQNGTVTFFEPQDKTQRDSKSYLKNIQYSASINEDSLQKQQWQLVYQLIFFDDIKRNPELINNSIDVLLIDSSELKNTDDHLVNLAIQKAIILIVNETLTPEQIYFTLKKISNQAAQKIADPLHLKPIFQINQSDIEDIQSRKIQEYSFNDSKQIQFDKFIDDLQNWGGYTEETVNKIKSNEKSDDKGIQEIYKLKKKISQQGKDEPSQSNIKKLLLGKMTSTNRRLNTQNQDKSVFEDIGTQIFEESFDSLNIEGIVDQFKNAEVKENNDEQIQRERAKAFVSALSVKSNSETLLQARYVQTLGKLLRLRSRTTLVTFIHFIDPLPIDILNSIESLDKLLLLSFNEACNIKNLTGDKQFYKQVKSLLERLVKDPSMKDFMNDFLTNQLIKPSQTVVKKMIENKEFLQKDVFDSEVDAQIFPIPHFIYSLLKMLLNHQTEIFEQMRGFLANSVSLLLAFSFAKSHRDPSNINTQIKFLGLAAQLLTYVRATKTVSPTLIKDVANIQFLMLLQQKMTTIKFQNSKVKEQVKILKEIYYEWQQIRDLQAAQESNQELIQFSQTVQNYKFCKRVNFLKTKDPLMQLQLNLSNGSINTVQDKISAIEKRIKPLPIDIRVPFMMKIKAFEKSDVVYITQTETAGITSEDKFNFYLDKNAQRQNKHSSSEFIAKEIYLTYQKTTADSFFFFGFTRRGRLNSSYSDETYRTFETFKDFDKNIVAVSSCKNGSIFLDTVGQIRHCGTIAGMTLSSQYEHRDYWSDVKLVTSGKRNLAFATKSNIVCIYGGNKNNHFNGAVYETSNWYKLKFKTALSSDDSIVSICSGNHFTCIVTQKGELLGIGDFIMNQFFQKPHDGDAQFTPLPIPEGLKPLRVWCSRAKYSKAVIIEVQNEQKETYLMSAGCHLSGILGQGNESDDTSEFKPLNYDYKKIQFKTVSILTNHAMAVTTDGQLYGWGSNLGNRLALDQSIALVTKPTPIPFFCDTEKFKVIDVTCGEDHSFVQVEEFDDVGSSLGMRLYQIGYNQEEAGCAHRGATKEEIEANQANNFITRVKNFDNLFIQAIACGHQTSFVYPVTPKNENPNETWISQNIKNEICPQLFKKGYLHIYNNQESLQDNMPIEADEEEVLKDKIEELDYQSVHRAALLTQQEEELKDDSPTKAKNREQQKLDKEQQRLTKMQTIGERKVIREKKKKQLELRRQIIMEKDPARQGWHFYTHQELIDKANRFPPVSIAIRHPIHELYQQIDYIKEIYEKAFEAVDCTDATKFTDTSDHGKVCGETGKKIVGASRYYASYMISDELKEIHLSEEAFAEPTEFDHMPLVYFRLTHPLKDGATLPLVDLTKFHKKDGEFKFEYKVTTSRLFYNNRQAVIDYFKECQDQDLFKKVFTTIFKNYETGYEKQVLQFFLELNESGCKELDKDLWDSKKDVLKYFKDGKNDDIKEELKILLNSLKKFTNEENYGQVNLAVHNLLFYLKIGNKVLQRVSERSLKNCLPDSLPHLRKQIISILPGYMKREMVNNMIGVLPCGDRFELTVRRRKAMAFAESGAVDHEGMHTIFGQIMQSQKKNSESKKCFRVNSVDSQIFRVEFKGEGSIDAGGPYRETLTNICNELQSEVLPLLIPTPNNKNNHGQNRESYMVNPSSTSPSHLEMFTYFGYFIGTAIRSEQALPLDLAPIFWKLILDEHETESQAEREMDLKAFDTYSWQVIDDLRSNTKDLSEEDFEAAIEEYFVTLLSNGSQVELIPGGKNIRVTKQNLDQYIKLVVDTRLNESQKQMKALKEGINYVINLNILKFLNSKLIEIRATGSKTLDVAKLKSITVYEGGSSSEPHIAIFWEVLESFTDEEKSLYLKFVWGRARLPASTQQNHKIVSMTYVVNACLPVSHTCFFTLDMPRYPTFEICRDRILFAIRFCGDIDADRSSYDIGSDE